MVSSVTSATVTATSAVATWGVILGAGGALLVVGLLIALELVGPVDRPWQRALQRGLRVSVAPLLLVFAVSVAVRALLILGGAAS